MSRLPRVIVMAVAFAGCGGGAASPHPASAATASRAGTGTRVELRFDETTEYRDLELRWLELKDSRCPVGLTCVWEGQIAVVVEVEREGEGPVEVELVLRAGHEPRALRAFVYELILRSVDPHPKRGVTPERSEYVAVLEVTAP